MFDLKVMLLIILLAVGAVNQGSAAGLSDPMRPPSGYAASASGSNGPVATGTAWVLQSVLLGEERAVAIIDGVPVSRGERYQGAELRKIETDKVVLRSRAGKKIILEMTPRVHKKVVFADTEISLK